ncbi:MAG: MBL fold metallo-hydrolase [Thermofilum sp.]|jgi:putative mRNA 3-end processing factor|nr:MBL fold metallo-hydrolase [Thermofilum sp.]
MVDLRLKFLGGAREVGRSAILLSVEGKQLLLDYGVSLEGEEPRFPLPVPPRELHAVTISHAHLDHSGAAPLLYVSKNLPLVSTPLTATLSDLLIRDFIKLSKYYIPYELLEVEKMLGNLVPLDYEEHFEVGSISIKMIDAGHIPGSAMIQIESPSLNILYTGDYSLHDTCLLRSADPSKVSKADVIIMESTYAEYNHPPRDEVEKNFINTVLEVVSNGGIAFIPVFAIGRAQEILCVLAKYDIDVPVYVDGMARAANDLILENKNLLREPKLFEKALEKSTRVRDWDHRKKILSKPGVIVSPAGMLQGGPSEYYMERIMENKRNAVIFVSFIIPGTPARQVLETGIYASPTKRGPVKARIEWFDFSAHCGHDELVKTLTMAKKEAKIILVHGEEESAYRLASLSKSMDREAYVPSLGEELKISL